MSIISIKQFELSAIKYSITKMEETLSNLKQEIRVYYAASDPDTPQGRGAFAHLNGLRNSQRFLKSDVAKLAKVAKLLKTEIRGENKHKPRNRGTRYPGNHTTQIS